MTRRKTGVAVRKLLRNEKWEVKEKTGDSGLRICKVPHTPVFCAKSAQTIETKGVDLPRNAKERGESAEAIETKRVECVDRFGKERAGFLERPLGEKWGRKFRMAFDLHSSVYHSDFTVSIDKY